MEGCVLARRTISASRLRSTAALLVCLWASAASAEDTKLRAPCDGKLSLALKHILGDASPPAPLPLAGMVFEKRPSVALFREDVPAAAKVLWAIPANREEYLNVYRLGEEPVSLTSEKIQQLADHGRQYVRAFGSEGRLTGKSAFDDVISQEQVGVVGIIGHNVHGELRFLDGSTASLSELVDRCSANKKVCVFLSCDSNAFIRDGGVGVDRRINAIEARWMAEKLGTFLAKKTKTNAVQLSEFVRQQSKNTKTKFRVVYIAQKGCKATVAGVAIAVVVCYLDDNQCGLTS